MFVGVGGLSLGRSAGYYTGAISGSLSVYHDPEAVRRIAEIDKRMKNDKLKRRAGTQDSNSDVVGNTDVAGNTNATGDTDVT